MQGYRQPVAFRRFHLNAHLAKRIEHPPHRPPRKRSIPNKARFHVVCAGKSHHQPAARTRISEIERSLGFEQAAVPRAFDDPDAGLLANAGAKRLHRLRGSQDIGAFQQPRRARGPGRNAAKHEAPVGNRLIAGYPRISAERLRRIGSCREWLFVT
jgi:hypothetical protein